MKRQPTFRALLPAVALALALAAPTTSFAEDPPPDQPPSGVVRLMAVGDVMLAQSIGRRIVRDGAMAPWAKVKGYFEQADLVVANLECTISKRGTAWPKTFTFRAPPVAADSLVSAGIDVVSVANNHSLDYGQDAFADTLTLLDQRAIGHAGGGPNLSAARAPLIVERNGLRIAFLGYVLPFGGRPRFSTRQWAATDTKAGLALGTPEVVTHDVTAARQLADVVVVMVHGGLEYSSRPSRAVKAFDKAAIAAGATLVIGHHPHVLQGFVTQGTSVIAYSIGNFVFDYFKGPMNDTAILDVTLSANGVEKLDWIPIVIQKGFPRPARNEEATRIMARLRPLPPP